LNLLQVINFITNTIMNNELVLFISSKPQLVINGDYNISNKIVNRVIDKVIESKSKSEKIKKWNKVIEEWNGF